MMQKILLHQGKEISQQTFYLGDYPQHSIQEWADLIITEMGKPRKAAVFPIFILRFLAKIGDAFKLIGWHDPPLTSFRLNNMLTGGHYPIEKTQDLVGELPFNLKNGVRFTLLWMKEKHLLRHELGSD